MAGTDDEKYKTAIIPALIGVFGAILTHPDKIVNAIMPKNLLKIE